MPPTLRHKSEKDQNEEVEVLSFLKSKMFANILQTAIKKEMSVLKDEITSLRTEVEQLKNVTSSQVDEILALKEALYNMQVSEKKKYSEITKINLNCSENTESIKIQSQSQTATADKSNTTGDKVIPQKIVANKNIINNNQNTMNSVLTNKNKTVEMNKNNNTRNINTNNVGPTNTKKHFTKRKNNTIHGTSNEASIKGATRYAFLHVSRLQPDLTEDKLIQYLEMKKFTSIKCEKLQSKYPEEYSSFKVSIPMCNLEDIKKPEVWPQDVCINRFFANLARTAKPT